MLPASDRIGRLAVLLACISLTAVAWRYDHRKFVFRHYAFVLLFITRPSAAEKTGSGLDWTGAHWTNSGGGGGGGDVPRVCLVRVGYYAGHKCKREREGKEKKSSSYLMSVFGALTSGHLQTSCQMTGRRRGAAVAAAAINGIQRAKKKKEKCDMVNPSTLKKFMQPRSSSTMKVVTQRPTWPVCPSSTHLLKYKYFQKRRRAVGVASFWHCGFY